MTNDRRSGRFGIWLSVALTLLYWSWESRTGGNIRVDLLLIYPILMLGYLLSLWRKFRYWSILLTAALMAANFAFFVCSYQLFHKNPG